MSAPAPSMYSDAAKQTAARLGLKQRDGERAVDDDERRQGGEDHPGVPLPEGGERHAEHRDDHVDRDRLGAEEDGLAEAVAAAELQHQREQEVVAQRERDGRKQAAG